MQLQKLIFLFLLTIFFSCKNTETDWGANAKFDYIKDKNLIDTIHLAKKTFYQELLSNGRLEAIRKAKLQFRVSGSIQKVFFSNGQLVKKGDVIAQINDFTIKNNLHKSKINLEKAKIELEDFLIGQGYFLNDTASVPEELLQTAKLKSGYKNALVDFQNAKYKFNGTKLIAPFTGVIADISKNEYDKISEGDNFCTLIDNKYFYVNFLVLETELDNISIGKKLSVKPLSGGEFVGEISQINPIVNENGLVPIYAKIKNTSGKLMEGMNVDVKIKTHIPKQLVVPKTAVVLRQNKEVVFTLIKDSIAIWNYVKVGKENTTHYTISDGLNINDIVITSGNVNLAHESIVEIRFNKRRTN